MQEVNIEEKKEIAKQRLGKILAGFSAYADNPDFDVTGLSTELGIPIDVMRDQFIRIKYLMSRVTFCSVDDVKHNLEKIITFSFLNYLSGGASG